MNQKISAYLERNRDAHLEYLIQICRIPTIAAQGENMTEMAQSLEKDLMGCGFSTCLLSVEGSHPVVYGELPGTGSETLLLYNHYDVQPPDPLDLWESPPFNPTIRDGKLFARGVGDDKGEIAVRLAAIQAAQSVRRELPFTLKWIIEGEEETGSPYFGDIVKIYSHLLSADACFTEGASVHLPGRMQLGLGSKGLLYIQLSIKMLSRDAHSKHAAVLPSAAWRLVQALACIRDRNGKVQIPGFYESALAPTTVQKQVIEQQQEDSESDYREIYNPVYFVGDVSGAALRQQYSFSPTCNICGFSSGYSGDGIKTVLPAWAQAKLDFRLVPNQDPEEILANLRSLLMREGFADIQVEVLASSRAVVTPLDTPLVQRIIHQIERFSGNPPDITPIGGGSQPVANILNEVLKIPCIGAPGSPVYFGSNFHSPNENICLEDFFRAIEFLCDLFITWEPEIKGGSL